MDNTPGTAPETLVRFQPLAHLTYVRKEIQMAAKTIDPADKGKVRVLVYGTLKKGHSNHSLLEQADATFMGYDSITGKFNMWDLGSIPATMASVNKHRIKGELYSMNPEGLVALDMLEGHPDFYRRTKHWTDIMTRRCWVYMLHSTRFLHEGVAEVAAQLWHASPEERKFWLNRSRAA